MEKAHKPQLAGKKRKHKSSTSGDVETKTLKMSSEPIKTVKQKKASSKTLEGKPKVPSLKVKSAITKAKKTSTDLTKSPKKATNSNILSPISKKVRLHVVKKDGDEKLKKVDKELVVNKRKASLDAVTPMFNNQEMEKKYPVLYNKDLVTQFLQVQMSNNQKGRIRQAIKMSLHGAPPAMYPDLIHAKIQNILRSSQDLTDSDLRRIRILYNMLKTALESPQDLLATEGSKKDEKKSEKRDISQKVKGPKRYVVFLGNLPLDINRETIMQHFAEFNESIKDIRIPKPTEGKKSAIAYVELMNEPSFELALSKHHSMLGSKRINVLYTAQKNSKISKSKAKGKSAKLIALQKSGKLVGSIPLNKKRSHRRAIMKKARAEEAKDT